jgi:hypothetical protein
LPGGIVKTPAELAGDVYDSVSEMEDHVFSVIDYTTLLLAMTEGTEILSEHVPGINRLLRSINEHGQALRRHWDEAHQASGRLAKP